MPDAAEIVAGLTTLEKLRLTSGRDFWTTEPIEAAGLAPVLMTDGPHGLRKQSGPTDHLGIASSVPATCFPVAATLGSTWDPELLEEVGAALGREAGAEGVALVLGPGLNLKRHPAGGRNFEYFSEDPLLSGKLAAALARGIQSQGVGACLKHFAANNQEANRMTVDAVIDERTLRELYLTGFEIAVQESRPWAVMCSYNRINGTYASDHRWLLTEVLRDEWEFDGFTVSDWGATNDRVAAVRAGLDLEMPGNQHAWEGEALAAIERGELTANDLDLAATRLVRFMQRATAAERGGGYDRDQHHALARRAAAAGSVLLTNDGILPLSAEANVALIGSLAERPRYQGAGSSLVNPTRLDAVLEHLTARADVAYAPGYDPISGATDDALLDQAVASAEGAEVAVVVVGMPPRYESEGFDRTTLALPEGHDRVVEAVLDTGTPTVVVLVNGAPVALPWVDRPAAILESYLGGQAGGSAIVDVLLGDEPGGRLAESFPMAVTDLPADRNFPGRPRQVEYRETFHIGYRFHDTADVPARFPFGHGLSYTTFEVADIGVEGEGTDLVVRATVTNTGPRKGSQVVQVYVRDPESIVPKPAKELAGFAKVQLAPGESHAIEVPLDRRSFAHWQPGTGWVVEAGDFEILVGTSSVDIVETVAVPIDSDDRVTPQAGTVGPVADDDEFVALLGHPIPEPLPRRPFHRTSAFGDIRSTRTGRTLVAATLQGARQVAGNIEGDEDGTMLAMMETILQEMPLRNIVTFSGGRIGPRGLDRLLHALNGEWFSVFGRKRVL